MLNTKSCEIQLELLDSSSPPQVPCSLHSLIFVFVFVLNTHTQHTLTTLLVFSQTRVEKGTRKGATGCKRESVESQPKLKHERGGVACRARRLFRDSGNLAPPCCLSPTALGPHGAISALDFLYASHHQRTGRVHPQKAIAHSCSRRRLPFGRVVALHSAAPPRSRRLVSPNFCVSRRICPPSFDLPAKLEKTKKTDIS